MKTIKKVLKYEVNMKFIVVASILTIINTIILMMGLEFQYQYILLFSFDYYIAKYLVFVINQEE